MLVKRQSRSASTSTSARVGSVHFLLLRSTARLRLDLSVLRGPRSLKLSLSEVCELSMDWRSHVDKGSSLAIGVSQPTKTTEPEPRSEPF